MPQLPVVSGKHSIVFLELIGFKAAHINGSLHRQKHADGRITTVPVHKNEDLSKGLIHKIIRDDLGLELDLFIKLYKQVK